MSALDDFLSGYNQVTQTANERLGEYFESYQDWAKKNKELLPDAINKFGEWTDQVASTPGADVVVPMGAPIGIVANTAKRNIISDLTQELGDKVKLAVSTKKVSPGWGSEAIITPGNIYKNKQKLVSGLEEVQNLNQTYAPNIRNVYEGLSRIEPFEQVQSLYNPIRSVSGRLEMPGYQAKYFPGLDSISFASGTKPLQPNTYAGTMLHELFHGKYKELDPAITKLLSLRQNNIAREFVNKSPLDFTMQTVMNITSPSELMAESSAQRLIQELLGSKPKSNAIRFEEFSSWPKSVSNYITDIIDKLK